MSIYNMEKMFHPKSVAVIGASEKKGSVGFAVMQNLIQRVSRKYLPGQSEL